MSNELSNDAKPKCLKFIETNEGFRQFPYKDSKGILTLGIGFNLESDGIPKPVAEYWLDYALKQREAEIIKHLGSVYTDLNDDRKIILLDIAYNCGIGGLLEFRHMVACLQSKDYQGAAQSILNSQLALYRKEKLALIMENGVL